MIKGIGNAVSGVMGMVYGEYQRKRQFQDNLLMAQQQQQYNKELMGMSHQMGKNMFDYTYKTKGDIVKELKEAGLNPALMYGMAGAGGQGSTAMPSGSAPAMQAPDRTAFGKMGIEAGMQRAQKRLIEAEAKKAEADAEKTEGVDTQEVMANIDQINANTESKLQETKNLKAIRAGLILQNKFDEIRNEIQEGSWFDQLNAIKWQATTALNNLEIITAQKEITWETKELVIEQYKANLKKTMAEILLKESQNTLTMNQAEKTANDIYVDLEKLILEDRDITTKEVANEIKKRYPSLQTLAGNRAQDFLKYVDQFTKPIEKIVKWKRD